MTSLPRLQAVCDNHVIAAIYETVIRAELCDQFLRSPIGYPEQFAEDVSRKQILSSQSTSGWKLHFTRAEEILEQQWNRAGRPAPEQFFEDQDRFWLLLNEAGQIVRASRVAKQHLQETEGDTVNTLNLGPKEQSSLRFRIAQAQETQFGYSIPEIYATADDTRKIMCRTVQCGQGLQATFKVMIESLEVRWTARARDMLSRTFDLHKQELQLLESYFGGTSISDLAVIARGGKASILAQLRDILAKSGAPRLEEMVRLFCFLIAEAVLDEEIETGAARPSEGHVQFDGCQHVQFMKLGAETGQPIIFLHGLLDGIAGVQRLQMQFRKRGFRVYSPLRCGYGRTGPVAPSECSFDIFVNQLEALIEQENLRRPILLGHRGAAAYTHVAARRLRDRVSGAVIVSAMAPVQNLSQLTAMRGYQRTMAVIATYCPRLMPVVAKRWEKYIQKTGQMALLRQRPEQDCKEGDAIESPDLINLLQTSTLIMQGQKSAGLMADYHWIVNDWQRHINGSSAPVIYLHGNEDQVTSVERLQKTMAGRRNVQVRLCNGAGAMLLYSRPELVLAALEELADG
mgnify:CR=1 FL=1